MFDLNFHEKSLVTFAPGLHGLGITLPAELSSICTSHFYKKSLVTFALAYHSLGITLPAELSSICTSHSQAERNFCLRVITLPAELSSICTSHYS